MLHREQICPSKLHMKPNLKKKKNNKSIILPYPQLSITTAITIEISSHMCEIF